MSESVVSSAVPSTADAVASPSAGRLLREARQAKGLHIAALATLIKVTPRKLEALESDRYDELPDATFTRALAQTVCRSLKIDAAPVLALLPRASGLQLEDQIAGLNTPFRERPGRPESKSWAKGWQPQVFGPVLLLLAAVGIYFWPTGFHPWRSVQTVFGGGAVASNPVTVNVPVAVPVVASQPELSMPAVPAMPASEAAAISAGAGGLAAATAASSASVMSPSASAALLELSVHQDSWIEVQDATSRALLARVVKAQEVVALNGVLPLKLKVGNASHTTVRFRGEMVDLKPLTRDNVARLELK